MAPNHGGDPLGSILGPMGSHWGQKMGQNRKKLPCPKIRILTTAQSSIWAKNQINGYGAKSRWGTPRVHLGANGVPLGPKNGSNGKESPCPKIRIFYYSARSSIWAKIEFMVMAPNHGGDPLGSILGPMGSHWGQKMGQKGKKLPCPKIRLVNYSAVIDLGKKSNLWLWRQITLGTP